MVCAALLACPGLAGAQIQNGAGPGAHEPDPIIPIKLPTEHFSASHDGRIVISTAQARPTRPRDSWWDVQVFRPEAVTRPFGRPDLTNALSKPFRLRAGKQFSNSQLGLTIAWSLGLSMRPGAAPNPFRSGKDGKPSKTGRYATYAFRVITVELGSTTTGMPRFLGAQTRFGVDRIGSLDLDVVVRSPYTADASVETSIVRRKHEVLRTDRNGYLVGGEPTVTADGRMIVYNGNSANGPGIQRYEQLMVSVQLPNGRWTTPRWITKLYDLRDYVLVPGANPLRVKDLYPLARRPLRRADGSLFGNSALGGAYPWLDPDGSILFAVNGKAPDPSQPNRRFSRGLYGAIGRATNWGLTTLDSRSVSPGRHTPDRQFLSGLGGRLPGMWAPFGEYDKASLPAFLTDAEETFAIISVQLHPSRDWGYARYGEVTFAPNQSGAIGYWPMTETLTGVVGEPRENLSTTPDISGNFHTGRLTGGAAFTREARLRTNRYDKNADSRAGIRGEAIHFPAAGSVRVRASASLNAQTSLTVAASVRAKRSYWTNGGGGERSIVSKAGVFRIWMNKQRRFLASISTSTGVHQVQSPPVIQLGRWHHVVASYDGTTGEARLCVDGVVVERSTLKKGTVKSTGSDLVIGPALPPSSVQDPNAFEILIDEVSWHGHVVPLRTLQGYLGVAPKQVFAELGQMPLGLRKDEVRIPIENRPSNLPEVNRIGNALFLDPRLSSNNTVSCSTCHVPMAGFADVVHPSRGVSQKPIARRTPTTMNRAFSKTQFWDGRAKDLASQVLQPIVHPDEMGMASLDQMVQKVRTLWPYRNDFPKYLGGPATPERMRDALASFLYTGQLAGNSKVDQHLDNQSFQKGPRSYSPLSAKALLGLELFRGRARCTDCHTMGHIAGYLSDEAFHVSVIAKSDAQTTDWGRYAVTGNPSDRKKFKTPSLRNVALRPPFMHDGSLKTLRAVVEAYNRGGVNPGLAEHEVQPLGLNNGEIDAIVAFLEALTSTR